MRILGESVYTRYLQIYNKKIKFPENGYKGEYIKKIANLISKDKKNNLVNEKDLDVFKDYAEKYVFKDIKSY